MKTNVRAIRKEKGMTQQDLADRLGVTWQTVSNIERGTTSLTAAKLPIWAEALEVEPHELIAEPEEARMVRVVGPVQAGVFAESLEFPEDDQYEVAIPNDPALRAFRLEGREVRGPSMNRRYPERTVVIISDMVETGAGITVGKRYVVERERADGLREATVKKLWQDEAGAYWLLPESDDPRHQEPIPLDGGTDDTIRIVGRVRYAVSRED